MTAQSTSETSQATLFTVGGVEYAVTGRVLRSLPAPSPRPASIEHRGETVALLDLPEIFGAPLEGEGEGLILLVEQEGERRAVVIQELTGFEELNLEALQPVPPVYPLHEQRRWHGVLLRPEGDLIVVLSLDGLSEVASVGDP